MLTTFLTDRILVGYLIVKLSATNKSEVQMIYSKPSTGSHKTRNFKLETQEPRPSSKPKASHLVQSESQVDTYDGSLMQHLKTDKAHAHHCQCPCPEMRGTIPKKSRIIRSSSPSGRAQHRKSLGKEPFKRRLQHALPSEIERRVLDRILARD